SLESQTAAWEYLTGATDSLSNESGRLDRLFYSYAQQRVIREKQALQAILAFICDSDLVADSPVRNREIYFKTAFKQQLAGRAGDISITTVPRKGMVYPVLNRAGSSFYQQAGIMQSSWLQSVLQENSSLTSNSSYYNALAAAVSNRIASLDILKKFYTAAGTNTFTAVQTTYMDLCAAPLFSSNAGPQTQSVWQTVLQEVREPGTTALLAPESIAAYSSYMGYKNYLQQQGSLNRVRGLISTAPEQATPLSGTVLAELIYFEKRNKEKPVAAVISNYKSLLDFCRQSSTVTGNSFFSEAADFLDKEINQLQNYNYLYQNHDRPYFYSNNLNQAVAFNKNLEQHTVSNHNAVMELVLVLQDVRTSGNYNKFIKLGRLLIDFENPLNRADRALFPALRSGLDTCQQRAQQLLQSRLLYDFKQSSFISFSNFITSTPFVKAFSGSNQSAAVSQVLSAEVKQQVIRTAAAMEAAVLLTNSGRSSAQVLQNYYNNNSYNITNFSDTALQALREHYYLQKYKELMNDYRDPVLIPDPALVIPRYSRFCAALLFASFPGKTNSLTAAASNFTFYLDNLHTNTSADRRLGYDTVYTLVSNIISNNYQSLDFTGEFISKTIIKNSLYRHVLQEHAVVTNLGRFISNAGVTCLSSGATEEIAAYYAELLPYKDYIGQNPEYFAAANNLDPDRVRKMFYDPDFLKPGSVAGNLSSSYQEAVTAYEAGRYTFLNDTLPEANAIIQQLKEKYEQEIDKNKLCLSYLADPAAYHLNLTNTDAGIAVSNRQQYTEHSPGLQSGCWNRKQFKLPVTSGPLAAFIKMEIKKSAVAVSALARQTAAVRHNSSASGYYEDIREAFSTQYDITTAYSDWQEAMSNVRGVNTLQQFLQNADYFGRDNREDAANSLVASWSAIRAGLGTMDNDYLTAAMVSRGADKTELDQTLDAAVSRVTAVREKYKDCRQAYEQTLQDYRSLYRRHYSATLQDIKAAASTYNQARSVYERCRAVYDYARTPYIVKGDAALMQSNSTLLQADALYRLYEAQDRLEHVSNQLEKAAADYRQERLFTAKVPLAVSNKYQALTNMTGMAIAAEEGYRLLTEDIAALRARYEQSKLDYRQSLEKFSTAGPTNGEALLNCYLDDFFSGERLLQSNLYSNSVISQAQSSIFNSLQQTAADYYPYKDEKNKAYRQYNAARNTLLAYTASGWLLFFGGLSGVVAYASHVAMLGAHVSVTKKGYKKAQQKFKSNLKKHNNLRQELFAFFDKSLTNQQRMNDLAAQLAAYTKPASYEQARNLLLTNNALNFTAASLAYLSDKPGRGESYLVYNRSNTLIRNMSDYKNRLLQNSYSLSLELDQKVNSRYADAAALAYLEKFKYAVLSNYYLRHPYLDTGADTYNSYFAVLKQAGALAREQARQRQQEQWARRQEQISRRFREMQERFALIKQRGRQEWQHMLSSYVSAYAGWRVKFRQRIEKGLEKYDLALDNLSRGRDQWAQRTVNLAMSDKLAGMQEELLADIGAGLKALTAAVPRLDFSAAECEELKNSILAQMGSINKDFFTVRDYRRELFTMGELRLDHFADAQAAALSADITAVQERNQALANLKMYEKLQDLLNDGLGGIKKAVSRGNEKVDDNLRDNILRKSIYAMAASPGSGLEGMVDRVRDTLIEYNIDGAYKLQSGRKWRRKYITDATLLKTHTGYQMLSGYRDYLITNFDFSAMQMSRDEFYSFSPFRQEIILNRADSSLERLSDFLFNEQHGDFTVRHIGKADAASSTGEVGRIVTTYEDQQQQFFKGLSYEDKPFWQKKMLRGHNAFANFFSLGSLLQIGAAFISGAGTAISLGLSIGDTMGSKAYYQDDMAWSEVAASLGQQVATFGAGQSLKGVGNQLLANTPLGAKTGGRLLADGIQQTLNFTANTGINYLSSYYEDDQGNLHHGMKKENFLNSLAGYGVSLAAGAAAVGVDSYINKRIFKRNGIDASYSYKDVDGTMTGSWDYSLDIGSEKIALNGLFSENLNAMSRFSSSLAGSLVKWGLGQGFTVNLGGAVDVNLSAWAHPDKYKDRAAAFAIGNTGLDLTQTFNFVNGLHTAGFLADQAGADNRTAAAARVKILNMLGISGASGNRYDRRLFNDIMDGGIKVDFASGAMSEFGKAVSGQGQERVLLNSAFVSGRESPPLLALGAAVLSHEGYHHTGRRKGELPAYER
ncbi:MAG TPA: hypothetical protein VKS21_09225, partial [Spirochaetota bacterium]|nr:hypothetical protein [Spirochaetota bacterium]